MTSKSSLIFVLTGVSAAARGVIVGYSSDVDYVATVGNITTGRTDLSPNYVYHIDSSSTQAGKAKSLIEAMKPDWTVSLGADAPGSIQINRYRAEQVYDGSGHVAFAGAQLKFDYYSSSSTLSNYRFVQVVYTNTPPSGAPTTGYIDPWVNDDGPPYVELP